MTPIRMTAKPLILLVKSFLTFAVMGALFQGINHKAIVLPRLHLIRFFNRLTFWTVIRH